MRVTAIARFVAASLLLAAAVACRDDGGDSMTLEEYFTELERIGDEAEARVEASDAPDVDPDASFGDQRDALVQLFEAGEAALGPTIDEMDELSPPDAVRDEHNEYVEAVRGLPDFIDGYIADVRAAGTQEELDDILTRPEEEAVFDRIDDACRTLQQIADENEIDVDLACDE